MTAVGRTGSGTRRSDWVSFSDELPPPARGLKRDGHHVLPQLAPDPAPPETPPPGVAQGGVAWQPDPAVQKHVWVQFEDKAWSSPAPWRPQVPGSSAAVPSRNPVSSASFWSAASSSDSSPTTRSEEPGCPSAGASCADLSSLPEDARSGAVSRAHSSNSSVFQEDEYIAMDAVSLRSTHKQTSSPTGTTTARFGSWVTFDDDEGNLGSPGTSSLGASSLNQFPLQDANSNFVARGERHGEREGKGGLLDVSLAKTNYGFSVESPLFSSSTPARKKNPFLDDDLADVQPSPINPFSAYFDKSEAQQSNGSRPESSHSYSFSSPFFTDSAGPSKESIFLFTPGFDASGEDVFGSAPQNEALEDLTQLGMADPDPLGSPTLPDDPIDEEEEEDLPFLPSYMKHRDGWPMMLRIPEKKNIMSSRHWGPIFVKVTETGCLQLFYEKGLEKPFKELQLDSSHELSAAKLQNYDENGRVHTVSVDHVVYKERRKIQTKVAVVHAPIKEQLIKLGTTNYEDFLSFMYVVQDRLMQLPVEMDMVCSNTSYAEEVILVDVSDEFHGVVSKGDNRILQQLVVTHVHVLAFISGSPLCKIGFNDIQVKGNEIVSRHDIIPNSTTRWIKLRDCRFHQSADEKGFTNSRMIFFTPPSGCRFELMRFRTPFAEKMLPFTMRTVATIKGAEVEVQSWLVMSSGFSSNRDPLSQIPCENVMIRYPVPLTWAKNFRRDSVMGEKSLKARINKSASFGSMSSSGSEPVMRVTLGTAKYEHAFKSVVWRINRLPDKNSASGHPHTFFCRLELGSDWEVPRGFPAQLEVEFDMPAASASRATVRCLAAGDRTDVRKWVGYKAHYSYQVEMEQKTDLAEDLNSLQTEKPNRCSQQ
uniref:Stonin-2 n=1 Tax=Lepisosteus oculatus TaxID=7918 RepID=W5MR97_LEPOC|nr:PREDICTED: stonin-2 isoform X1 [Lepisosteus oculatus]XP_015205753.1 PREDICTED: stonin-2 isoform X1 [Lepisosteus oculatus]XP_015205754.1 PREDICTED: stonin-2 isoform X1 [Lepisosteus oculatus]XP_015205755.1 PREDICTED: stonin-2 isoform X1 [Lepisosteus oculatus]XP_015205756.1 PREDICTED: stonin-2 isoform X1 [Lepisosteus oculatus]XP_015205757.1 PREDICTED: stonin-2 isoform X1 [Lepisosteus oculatus]